MFIHVHVRMLLTSILVVHHNFHFLNVPFEPGSASYSSNYTKHTRVNYTCNSTRDSHRISLHLLPCLSSSLLPVQRIQMTEDVCCCGREDPLGVSRHGLVNNVAGAVQGLGRHLEKLNLSVFCQNVIYSFD